MTARSTHIQQETLKTRRLFRHPFYEKLRQSTRLARLLLVETLKRNPLELKDTPNSTYKAFRIYVFAWPDGLDDICQQRNMTLDHPSRSQVSSDTREKRGGKKGNAETFQSIAQFNKKFPRVARKKKKNGKNFDKFLKQLRFLEMYKHKCTVENKISIMESLQNCATPASQIFLQSANLYITSV